MTEAMRILAIVICAALTISSARADALSAADREALLENLEKLRDAATAKVDARFRIAINAYRDASASDEAAMELYLKCYDKVNFEDQQKDKASFLIWKRQDDVKAKLGDPGFKMALRIQLRWLILTLQASSEKANMKVIAAEGQEVVDGVFQAADKLRSQEQELAQAVTSTVFARAYEIGHVDKENKWPLSPIQLDAFYGSIVFPPLRSPERVETLHAAWNRRIQQEMIKVEAWGGAKGRANPNPKGKGRGEKPDHKNVAPDKSPEYERFMTETLPELQWQMEMDLFRSGDESGAAKRMIKHILNHPDHRSCRTWSEDFKNLLKPKPVVPVVPPVTPVE